MLGPRDPSAENEELVASPAPQASPAFVDYAQLYRTACAEHGCRVNSAVLQYLGARPTQALVTLDLKSNYVGPKGLGPLLELIQRCQTLTSIGLSGNGLNNACVERLCEVLKDHLGVTSLDLSDNPMTNDAGKPLMGLLSHNRCITALTLESVDIFAALRERIQAAVEENKALRVPRLTTKDKAATADDTTTTSTVSYVGGPSVTTPKAPMAVRVSVVDSNTIRISGKRSQRSSPYAGFDQQKDDEQTVNRGNTASSKASLLTPKPPNPALAANDHSRLSRSQQVALRESYKSRRNLYVTHSAAGTTITGATSSEAAKAAALARYQLAMLEAAEERSNALAKQSTEKAAAADDDTAMIGSRSNEESKDAIDNNNTNNTLSSKTNDSENNATDESQSDSRLAHVKDQHSDSGVFASTLGPAPPASHERSAVNKGEKGRHQLLTAVSTSDAGDEEHGEKNSTSEEDTAALRPYEGPPVTTNAAGQTITISKDPSVAPFVVPPTREEQFQALFDEGCEAYKANEVDLAFLRWSEAAAFAQEHRNREWIAIVTSNMQRLSYDLLVADGQRALEAGILDEAEKHFAFAMDVAVKSKNTAWEAEMTKARRNVQYAVFQREQDNSTVLFEKAVRAPDEELSEDDLFLGPDGVRVVSHTSAFHNEWRRMLTIHEALSGWVGASKVATKISGPSSRVLLDIVASSVLNVTQYLIKQFFSEVLNNDMSTVFSQQGTARYRYDEAESLRSLWEEIILDTASLNCPPLQAVGRCHMGHLCLALNRLSEAAQQFRLVVGIAESTGDVALAAIVGTYLSMAHHQARDYNDTDKALARSTALWEAIAPFSESNHPSWSSATRQAPSGTTLSSPNNPQQLSSSGPQSASLPNARAVQKGPLTKIDASDPANTDIAVGYVVSTSSPSSSGEMRTSVTQASAVVADALLANAGASLRGSLFYRYVPHEVLRHLHRHCYHLTISILVTPPRSKYLAALEVVELSLQRKFSDTLASKVSQNFASKPTLDHISAAATIGKSMFVYLKLTTDFRWDVEQSRFDVYEYLHSWCVPESGDISFSTIDVHEASGGHPTVAAMIKEVRRAFRVDPLTWKEKSGGDSEGMVLSYSDRNASAKWVAPLKSLYDVIVEPVGSFIHSHNAYDPSRVLTIIPSDGLWAVPFGALAKVDSDSQQVTFFIEEIALQLSFSGIYSNYASLQSLQARERDAAKVVLVDSPQPAGIVDTLAEGARFGLKFPLDPERAAEEISLVSSAIAKGMALGVAPSPPASEGTNGLDSPNPSLSAQQTGAAYRSTVLTKQHCVVSKAPEVAKAMIGARFVHIAAPSSSSVPMDDECATGGLCLTDSYGSDLALFHNSEISKLDLFAQLVTMSNTCMDPSLLDGLRDGTVCLIRAFLAAGCPAVVAAMWNTPEMFPVDLFQRLYLLHLEPEERKLSEMRPSGPRPAVPPRIGGVSQSLSSRKGSEAADAMSAVSSHGITIVKRRNKALAMAMAIRELLSEASGPVDYRRAPQHWAGFFMVGVGE